MKNVFAAYFSGEKSNNCGLGGARAFGYSHIRVKTGKGGLKQKENKHEVMVKKHKSGVPCAPATMLSNLKYDNCVSFVGPDRRL